MGIWTKKLDNTRTREHIEALKQSKDKKDAQQLIKDMKSDYDYIKRNYKKYIKIYGDMVVESYRGNAIRLFTKFDKKVDHYSEKTDNLKRSCEDILEEVITALENNGYKNLIKDIPDTMGMMAKAHEVLEDLKYIVNTGEQEQPGRPRPSPSKANVAAVVKKFK